MIIDKEPQNINIDKTSKRGKRAKSENSWSLEEMRNQDGSLTDLGWNRVDQLTRLIIKKHFSKIPIYSDLVQIGIVKSSSVLSADPENGNYKSLRTYLYTCIRNEISNYLYHTHKRTKESSESLIFCKTNFKNISIDSKYIEVVFSKLTKRFEKHKKFLTWIVNVLSDTDAIDDNEYNMFIDELTSRLKIFNIVIQADDKITNHVFELLYPDEISILTLIAYEIKKDIAS